MFLQYKCDADVTSYSLVQSLIDVCLCDHLLSQLCSSASLCHWHSHTNFICHMVSHGHEGGGIWWGCVCVCLTTTNGGSWGSRVEQREGNLISIGVLGNKLNADGGVDFTADDGWLCYHGRHVTWQVTVTPPKLRTSWVQFKRETHWYRYGVLLPIQGLSTLLLEKHVSDNFVCLAVKLETNMLGN